MTENEKKMTAVVKSEDIEALIELFEASDWDERDDTLAQSSG